MLDDPVDDQLHADREHQEPHDAVEQIDAGGA
jgi:hypothetical protein